MDRPARSINSLLAHINSQSSQLHVSQSLQERSTSVDDSCWRHKTQQSAESSSHNLERDILSLLQEIRDEQKSYMKIRRKRWNMSVDCSQVAQQLWENDDVQKKTSSTLTGRVYLEYLLPSDSNMLRAKEVFSIWATQPDTYPSPWNDNFLPYSTTWKADKCGHLFKWPLRQNFFSSEEMPQLCCFNKAGYAIATRNFKCPMILGRFSETLQVLRHSLVDASSGAKLTLYKSCRHAQTYVELSCLCHSSNSQHSFFPQLTGSLAIST